MINIERLNEIKRELKFGAEIEGEDYAHKALSKDDVIWLIKTVEHYEKAMNKSILQIDLVHTDESDADSALNYVFNYLKEALNRS
jgi:hypothetical protein